MRKIIIADCSCLIAFDNIEYLSLLRDVFTEIKVTSNVVIEFGQSLPEWFIVHDPADKDLLRDLLTKLDPGEASSIALAKELANSLLIIDEKKGRGIARSFDIEIIGSLRVLLLAKEKSIVVEVKPIIEKLIRSDFRISPQIIKEILALAQEL